MSAFSQALQHWPEPLLSAVEMLKSQISPDQFGFAEHSQKIHIKKNLDAYDHFTIFESFSKISDGYECYGLALYINNFLIKHFSDLGLIDEFKINVVKGQDELEFWTRHIFTKVEFNGNTYFVDLTPPYHLRMPSTAKPKTFPLQHTISEALTEVNTIYYDRDEKKESLIYPYKQNEDALQYWTPYAVKTIHKKNYLFILSMLKNNSADTYLAEIYVISLPKDNYADIVSLNDLSSVKQNSYERLLHISKEIAFNSETRTTYPTKVIGDINPELAQDEILFHAMLARSQLILNNFIDRLYIAD